MSGLEHGSAPRAQQGYTSASHLMLYMSVEVNRQVSVLNERLLTPLVALV